MQTRDIEEKLSFVWCCVGMLIGSLVSLLAIAITLKFIWWIFFGESMAEVK